MKNPFSLEDKTILVTGASSGIGRSVAVECSRMGARVVITARNEQRLAETLSLLSGEGHEVIAGDLCDDAFISSLAVQCPPLDGVVHSAGIIDLLPVKFISARKMDQVFSINFRAPVFLTRELLTVRCINPGGSLVFISSISGNRTANIGNSLYSASKGAINGFTKALALEIADQSARANTIMPALVYTTAVEELLTSEQIEKDVQYYPLGRHGRPEEVAWAAIYLLSDASQWVTGSDLLIDGGLTLL